MKGGRTTQDTERAAQLEDWKLSLSQPQSQLFLTKNLLCSPVILSSKKGGPN